MKVSIIYGWAEGPWQGKRLRKVLHDQGYHITKNPQEADIIIAHSGGCYMVPESGKANVVLLVGMPYWPGKHPFEGVKQKIRDEVRDTWWYKNMLFNTYYLFTRPRRWIKMRKAWQQNAIPQDNETVFVFVRNEEDQYAHPVHSIELAKEKDWNIEQVPGHHDHIWQYPEEYVDILKKHEDTA